MSTDVAIREFPPDQVELIKRTIARGATDDELALFIGQCRRTGLDPFAKQIYCIKRYDSNLGRHAMAIQTSIDGFRLIADRTKETDGQEGPFWCGPDGVWKDVWLSEEPPAAAKMLIYRKGQTRPYAGVANYAEYVQTTKEGLVTRFWAQMPALMLAKCAESLALRKAFPQELSGLYTAEESGEVIEGEATAAQPPKQQPALLGHITQEQGRRLSRLIEDTGNVKASRDLLFARYKIARLGELPLGEFDDACAYLSQLPKVKPAPIQTPFDPPKPTAKKWHLQVHALLAQLKPSKDELSEFLSQFEALSVEELNEAQSKEAIDELTKAVEAKKEAEQFEREQAELAGTKQ